MQHVEPLAFIAARGVAATVALAPLAWREPRRAAWRSSSPPGCSRRASARRPSLSSAVTFTILTVALQHTPPAEAAVIVSLETVFAAAAAYIVLGERLAAIGWLGAGLILLATLVLQLGSSRYGRAAGRAPWRRPTAKVVSAASRRDERDPP